MMINKAILHIMDFNSDVCVFSQKEMDFSNVMLSNFLVKHLERIQKDDAQKHGEFKTDSDFLPLLQRYNNGEIEFVEFSTAVAQWLYHEISISDILESTDLLVVDYLVEEQPYIALLLMVNKAEFTHQVYNDDNVIHNEIINHFAILPSASQRVGSYAIINCNDYSIGFVDKRRIVDGKTRYVLSEGVLKCTSTISAKEAVKIVNKITTKIAEDNGTNATIAVTKAKTYLMEKSEVSTSFSPADIGREVFSDSPFMQSQFESKAEEAHLPETIELEKEVVIKTSKNHKIKTDTGIEINVPAEYFEDSRYIEFINNDDGTISIELKNIGKIINK
ncbi:MAG TPA: nucleoid-associated protein [Clostridiales bacterium]|nr:nucleoid-associated protein [Clostridiales bacterium]